LTAIGGNFSVVFILFHNNYRTGPLRPRLELRGAHANSTDSPVAAPALLPENPE
jgi:hypothetical protein